jgi:hypothetical protein
VAVPDEYESELTAWLKEIFNTTEKERKIWNFLTGLSLINFKQQFKVSKYTDWTENKLEFKKGILSSPNVKPEKGKGNSETVLHA